MTNQTPQQTPQQTPGQYLQECRLRKRVTQHQLAEQLGVTVQAISGWENGRGSIPLERLRTLATKLQMDPKKTLELLMRSYRAKVIKALTKTTKEKGEGA